MNNSHYIWEGICDHYDQKMHRNIVDRTRIWISCDDKTNLQNVVRGLPGDDIIMHQDYEIDDFDGDITYNCEVWIKDKDRMQCLTYLNSNNYTLI